MKVLLALVVFLLCVGQAIADEDQFSVVFDIDGYYHDRRADPGEPVDVYFTVLNPSADLVAGLEFGYELVLLPGDEDKFVRLSVEYPPQAINVGDSADPYRGEYVIGLGTPLPSERAVIMVKWTVMLAEAVPVYFSLGPIRRESIDDGLPAYEAGGTIVPLRCDWVFRHRYTIGSPGFFLVAMLNDRGVSIENASFGSVKALYR